MPSLPLRPVVTGAGSRSSIGTAHGGISGARVGAEKDEAHGQAASRSPISCARPRVPRAMVQAFEAAQAASLAWRLVGAVRAGKAAGGEFQPIVSAALLSSTASLFCIRPARGPECIADRRVGALVVGLRARGRRLRHTRCRSGLEGTSASDACGRRADHPSRDCQYFPVGIGKTYRDTAPGLIKHLSPRSRPKKSA